MFLDCNQKIVNLWRADDESVVEANGNYSTTNLNRFVLQPSGTQAVVLNKLVIAYSDTAGTYNKIGDVDLSSGVGLKLAIEKVREGLDPKVKRWLWADGNGDSYAVKSTQQFAELGGVLQLPDDASNPTAIRTTVVEFDFSDNPLTIYGRLNERLAYILNDNLSGLERHRITAHCKIYPYG